jgi:hypothetical protein
VQPACGVGAAVGGLSARLSWAHLGQSGADLVGHLQVLHGVQQRAALQELHGQVVGVLLISLLSTTNVLQREWLVLQVVSQAGDDTARRVGATCVLRRLALATRRWRTRIRQYDGAGRVGALGGVWVAW